MNNDIPHRDDKVAAWLKQERDNWHKDSQNWLALDWALDDYRLHADTGKPLDEDPYDYHDVVGEYSDR